MKPSEIDRTMTNLARRTDPESSFEAAQDFVTSGSREVHEKRILTALQAHPWSTGRELTRWTGLSNVQILRRMADLEREGKVTRGDLRPCRVTGRRMTVWRSL